MSHTKDTRQGIRIGCCSFLFGGVGLADSLRLCRQIGFTHVDVSAADIGPKAHVDQREAVAHPEQQARRVRELADRYELQLEEVFLCPVFVDGERVEVSHPDAGTRQALLENFRKLCAFTASAGFRSIMAVPGTPQEGIDDETARSNAVDSLNRMAAITEEHGIRLSAEPHAGSLIQDPGAALRMAREVPGLTFTLDYAHYEPRGIPCEDVFPLHAHTAHMHARQACVDNGHCAIEEGTIDFEAIVADLKARQWNGTIAMEFFGGIDDKPWKEHAVVQNVALASQLAVLADK